MSDLTAAIEDAAAKPRSVAIDGLSVQQQSVAEVIAADRYLKAQAAAARPHFGLRFTKLVPPGGGS